MVGKAAAIGEAALKLRLAVRASGLGIWDWDVLTGEMNYSARARSICGFGPDTPLTLDDIRAVTHPEDLPRTSAMAQRALDPLIRAKDTYEYRIVRADTGATRWVVAHGEAIFAGRGQAKRAIRYIGTIADITGRKAADDALRDSEMRQRLAIDAARMAVWEIDVQSGTVSNSVELNRLFGFPDEARPTLEDLRACYCPGERERVIAGASKAFAEGLRSYEAEFRCQRFDGEIRWLLLRVQPIYSETNTLTRAIGVVMDIDDRKRAEERQNILLRELNHRVKNSLAVIQAISAQTFRGRADAAAIADFQERLGALADANDILLSADWQPFSARALIERLLEPYGAARGTWEIEGQDFDLPPRLNVPLALVIHELATNAAKYGALSAVDGRVTVKVASEEGRFTVVWQESGGPPVVMPAERGFGIRLITQVLVHELAEVDLQFLQQGVRCQISGTVVGRERERL